MPLKIFTPIKIDPKLSIYPMYKPITPQVLLPFEWDKQKPKTEFVSKEEDKNRLERRMKNKIC